MSLYNEYLVGAEREAAVLYAESEAQFARLNVLFEAVDATLEANMVAAEAKVFAENGTYDDLVMLYTEAGNEAAGKKQNIFAAMLEALGKLFSKIGKFFTDKFGKNLENIPEGEFKIDKDLETKTNVFIKAWNYIKSPFEVISKGKDGGFDPEEIKAAWGKIAAEVGAVAATGVTVATIVVKREVIIGWISKVRDEIQKKVNGAIGTLKAALGIGKVVNDVAKSGTESDGEDADKKQNIGDKLLAVGNVVLNGLKQLGGWISSWMGKLASAIGLTKKQAEKEADASEKPAKDDAGSDETSATESVSLFGIELDSDDTFFESEMTDAEYDELCELFGEL